MKTTLEIQDELLLRAKRRAKKTGRTLRSVVEEGLRAALADEPVKNTYRLPDMRVGDPDAEYPLDKYSWEELRDIIYDEAERYREDGRE